MSSIEGIPEGWELVRVGRAMPGHDYVYADGSVKVYDGNAESDKRNYVIIRRIERPKQYRAFSNAAEFEPHRDRWIQRSAKHDTKDTLPSGCFKVVSYNDHHVWTVDGKTISYEQMFSDNKTFDDGSPFGVEVTG